MEEHNDLYFMAKALQKAREAFLRDEIPVGAVLVLDGKIIARAHNQNEALHDPTAHAEILAIRKASRRLGNQRLSRATLYVTLEPCSMCAGASIWARIGTVVYGAKEPKGGAIESSMHLFEEKGINHRPSVRGGILEKECAELLKSFFQKKRNV